MAVTGGGLGMSFICMGMGGGSSLGPVIIWYIPERNGFKGEHNAPESLMGRDSGFVPRGLCLALWISFGWLNGLRFKCCFKH